jgi:hypothetical protein
MEHINNTHTPEIKMSEIIELFHTSPKAITRIHAEGIYVMSAKDVHIYKTEISTDELISARRLFWHEDAALLAPLVEEVMARIGVEEETAESLISEKTCLIELDQYNMDDDWWLQRVTARAAKTLGYRGCIMTDEQGGMFMIDMEGRENELEKIGEEIYGN